MKIYIFCPYKNKLKKYNKQIKGKNMESSKKYFGARIKEIREKRGLNQEQLAELVGMESRHISRIETGRSFTTLENIEKIALALNVELKLLFSFSHKKEKQELIKEINTYLASASNDKLELVHKIIIDIFN